MNKVLYGLTKSGKIKTWEAFVEGDGVLVARHGTKDGKKTESRRTDIVGKNVGKSNETTRLEQAHKECESLYNKKYDELYRDTEEELKDLPILPMLAADYAKHKDKIVFPCMLQPKLDGIRCLAYMNEDRTITYRSRRGKEFTTLSFLDCELTERMSPGMILDGELYVHGWPFERIVSAVKKEGGDTKELEYRVYDIVSDEDFRYRAEFLEKLFSGTCANVSLVHTRMCEHWGHVENYHHACTGLGYEGCMVRNVLGGYQVQHRSYDLQKCKLFEDAEFEIIRATKDANGRVLWKCVAYDKSGQHATLFDCSMNCPHEKAQWYYENREEFYGKKLTVRYFGLTMYGAPRFPRGVAIRDYE